DVFDPGSPHVRLIVAADLRRIVGKEHRLAYCRDRWAAPALPLCGLRTVGASAAQLRGNFANVAAAHPVTGREIHCDRGGSAGDRRLADSNGYGRPDN